MNPDHPDGHVNISVTCAQKSWHCILAEALSPFIMAYRGKLFEDYWLFFDRNGGDQIQLSFSGLLTQRSHLTKEALDAINTFIAANPSKSQPRAFNQLFCDFDTNRVYEDTFHPWLKLDNITEPAFRKFSKQISPLLLSWGANEPGDLGESAFITELLYLDLWYFRLANCTFEESWSFSNRQMHLNDKELLIPITPVIDDLIKNNTEMLDIVGNEFLNMPITELLTDQPWLAAWKQAIGALIEWYTKNSKPRDWGYLQFHQTLRRHLGTRTEVSFILGQLQCHCIKAAWRSPSK